MADLLRQTAKPKTLRPHQAKAIELLRQSIGSGNKRVVVQAPTGYGKTLTAAKIIQASRLKGNRVIFTAPAVSLIDQTVEAFESEGLQGIGVMQANHPRTNPHMPIQVASVQTLARREIPDAALVMVDECHIRSKAIDDLMAERADVTFVGLSATPWRKGMGLAWDDMVTPITIGELIDQGYLSKFEVLAPDVPDLTGVKKRGGDYVEAALAELMGDAKLVGSVVETWLRHGEDRPTLAFAVNRAHAAALQREFEGHGIASAYVDGFTDRVEREYIGQQFKRGDVRVICSVRTMTTGVDLPVSCIVDAAPTASEMLHVQKIGRGLRVNEGTEDCLILDHAGNTLRLGKVTDIRHDELDKSKPGEPSTSAKSEKVQAACSACSTVFSGLVCPTCGKEKKQPPNTILIATGELVRIDEDAPKPATKFEKQRFWSMALWLSRERGKGKKLAYGLYKGKFGVWPRGLSDVPTEPDQAFMSYEKSRRIAYAKMMEKRRETA